MKTRKKYKTKTKLIHNPEREKKEAPKDGRLKFGFQH